MLVASPAHRALGIGRLERFVDDPATGKKRCRVFFYEARRFEILDEAEVIPAPAGVWHKEPA